ncbi:reverse transcriptase [Phytophthora megakarya]|uniref:Reverse transcriptase n=1 Tax=Phytophthora megakarya TaxID=4795 RepID=A0A225W7J5_9STRA|nr:reverse transcriptase [Phytophthora megakarya]
MIDNALYGSTRIPKSEDRGSNLDVFEDGEPVDPGKPSVLGRRAYIDDILIPANYWNQLCDRGEGLLKACDEWNLSISVVKSFWGMPKVEYLGHRVSHNGLEANPKDLSALTDLAFPGSLRAMQSFLGSLNYYSRFIEDNAIYVSVLYELREIDFVAMMKEATQVRIQQVLEEEKVDQGSQENQGVDHRKTLDLETPDPTEEYDQIYYPVMYASRTLTSSDLNYGIAKKEVLALQMILDLNIGITKCVKGEDEILGALAASISPRSEVDKALISIAPKKEPRRKIQAPIPTIRRDEELYVVSFDGSARVKRGGGAYNAILWKLPEWTVLKARSGYAEGLTVNEAEYHGLLLCLDLLEDLDSRRLVICGDSNLRDRFLASAALQRQCGIEIESDIEIQDLITLNRLDEILLVKVEEEIAQISAVTTRSKARSGVRIGSDPDSLREKVVRELRIERIRQAQDDESWITCLKKYLVGEIRDLTQEEAKMFGSIAMNYEVDQLDLLFYCPTTKEIAADRDKLMWLVLPETLQQDILHHYHTSLQGSHQGICRTYDPIRDHFHWRGLYKSVQRYVGECVDCEIGKGRPRIQGESPGNLQATYPFQIIAMDHISSLPSSFNGNNELLILVDLFSGYVIAKISASRSAQTIAETYEECVFADMARARSWDNANGLPWRIDPKLMDLQNRDWDEYAGRLTFAINTARDRIRGMIETQEDGDIGCKGTINKLENK